MFQYVISPIVKKISKVFPPITIYEKLLGADNDLNGSLSSTDHLGCSVGDDGAKGTGVSCADGGGIISGNYTDTITTNVSASGQGVLSINYTVVANTSIDITSASIAGAGVVVPAAATSSTPTTPPSLQATVSRSQSKVVATNIGTRLSSIGSPVGVGGNTPGSNVPGGGPDQDGTKTNLTSMGTSYQLTESTEYSSQKGSMRGLAMMASFDTSEIYLSAAGNDNKPVLPPQNRDSLLADRPYTVWGHGSYTNVDNSRNNSEDDARYNGDVWGYNLGMDYRFEQNLYGGFSLGYSETDLTTIYNSEYLW